MTDLKRQIWSIPFTFLSPLPDVSLFVQIISHRGHWLQTGEKNTAAAFARSFENGYGTETDVRDMAGELVVSHDPPRPGSMRFAELLDLYAETDKELTLALNVKADGLQELLADGLMGSGAENYFLFDMSVPDLLVSLRHGLRCFTRQSDAEPIPALYEESSGVWLDSLRREWAILESASKILKDGKQAAIVSPELHGRPHLAFWEALARSELCGNPGLILCTDFPDEASRYLAPSAP